MTLLCTAGGRDMPNAFVGGRPIEKPETFYRASPINYVSIDDPPLLMVSGDLDVVVPLEQSGLLLDVYLKAGLDARLIVVQNAGHGFQPANDKPVSPDTKTINTEVLNFFTKYLMSAK